MKVVKFIWQILIPARYKSSIRRVRSIYWWHGTKNSPISEVLKSWATYIEYTTVTLDRPSSTKTQFCSLKVCQSETEQKTISYLDERLRVRNSCLEVFTLQLSFTQQTFLLCQLLHHVCTCIKNMSLDQSVINMATWSVWPPALIEGSFVVINNRIKPWHHALRHPARTPSQVWLGQKICTH